MTLVILAAGTGSRFGGLKQIEPVGPNGEFIIDYSIYDAINAGFDELVFIIKEENYEIFRKTIGRRIEDRVKVRYVFQRNDDLPAKFKYINNRVKPWGTAHAVLACKDVINSNFAIINADDFYGKESFAELVAFLRNNNDDRTYAMIGYKIANTLPLSGIVKRGVCKRENEYLKQIIESNVIRENNIISAQPLDGGSSFDLDADDLVSMNMFCFTPYLFKYLEERFATFLEENKSNLDTCEYLISTVVFEQIKLGCVKVRIIPTSAKWLGITYKEDKELVMEKIKQLHIQNVYPDKLW